MSYITSGLTILFINLQACFASMVILNSWSFWNLNHLALWFHTSDPKTSIYSSCDFSRFPANMDSFSSLLIHIHPLESKVNLSKNLASTGLLTWAKSLYQLLIYFVSSKFEASAPLDPPKMQTSNFYVYQYALAYPNTCPIVHFLAPVVARIPQNDLIPRVRGKTNTNCRFSKIYYMSWYPCISLQNTLYYICFRPYYSKEQVAVVCK